MINLRILIDTNILSIDCPFKLQKKYIDKKGVNLKSIYVQLLFLLNLKEIY